MTRVSLIVIGALNTDIIASGVSHFPKPGEHVYGKELVIGPGGKSRNIAAMASHLMSEGRVAMIGRTAKDKYGLWEPPVTALYEAGVNSDFVKVLPYSRTNKLPSIVLIAVDKHGDNQLYALPGISDDFSRQDIDDAGLLFNLASKNQGMLVLSLECPIKTSKHAIDKANTLGIKVAFDTGGILPSTKVDDLLASGIYLIKPNEHEAKIITGVDVTGFDTAKQAANILMGMGAQNILITHGDKGGYLFTKTSKKHFKAPDIGQSVTKDATGCGDQTMASLCALLQDGMGLEEAAELAIRAGTLQFHKAGIHPLTRKEVIG